MAEETGKLKVDGRQATLNGKILALCDKPDSIAAALGLLRQRGFDEGSEITVTGSDSSIGSVPVFCIESVVRADALAARVFALKKFAAGKKQAKKKSEKKAAAKKKGAVRKAGKKAASKKKSTRGLRSPRK